MADVIDDVRLLGEVRYAPAVANQKKLLQKKYFIDLVALLSFHVKQEFREERA